MEYRMDPVTYHFERRNAIEALKKSKYELIPLLQVADFGKIIVSENPENLTYVGLENIESDTGIYVETSEKETFGSAIKFKKGQILFPKLRPYLNKVYYADFDGLCSTEFHILDSSLVDNRYLTNFLRSKIVVSQTKYLMSGNTLPRLQTDDIYKLLIPVPNQEIQQKTISIFEQAYETKRANAIKADDILKSIDNYLLTELGIILPQKQGNTLKNRVFLQNINEISGGRFDAFYFVGKEKIIQGGKFKNQKLKVIANITKGQSITKENVIEGDYPVIAGGQSSPYFHNQYNYENNIITVSASGAYAGFIWYHDYPIFASDCCVIQSKNKSDISILFLTEILKLKQKEIYNLQQGSGQPHVYASDLAELQIPTPTLEVQERIVKEIMVRRNKAQALQIEAKELIEKAKAEVEKMILGE